VPQDALNVETDSHLIAQSVGARDG